MIELRVTGSGRKTEAWLRKISRGDISAELAKFGDEGVRALQSATPKNTGLAAFSWGYRVIKLRKGYRIEWFNTDTTGGGTPIVILIQYGHATGNGAYISGRDFINPAMRPVFDKITNEIWKKVKNG